jgi:hypothetical protein
MATSSSRTPLGDNPPKQPRLRRRVNKEGGKIEVVDLPKVGIRGNSHMIMMDRNSGAVAEYIQAWLERQGLFQ